VGVENNHVLIKDKGNKNESAKLAFLASVAQSTAAVMEVTVEENTCEEGGSRNTPTPTAPPEEPSHPLSTQGSADGSEEGTVGSHL
jgi:hypothetical protein